jgi:ribosomal protein L29
MAQAKKITTDNKDIKSLNKTELMSELRSIQKELYTLQMKHSLGELKQPHQIRKARRTIAQLSTALSTSSI